MVNGGLVLPAVDILYEGTHSSNMTILLLCVLILLNKRTIHNTNVTQPGLEETLGQIAFYEIETF